MRYAEPTASARPKTAFNFCAFWFIEALHLVGRTEEAREMFETDAGPPHRMRGRCRRTSAFFGRRALGNYPQTYSLVGLINCAVMLSRPWSSVR